MNIPMKTQKKIDATKRNLVFGWSKERFFIVMALDVFFVILLRVMEKFKISQEAQ